MEDKFLGIGLIGLEDWLERASKQGLPPNDVKSGNLNYWYPKNGAVAGFGAYSVWVGLDCNGSPLGSDPGLGIRLAKLKE
ncbi:hypothetical protein HYX19_00695 [Candidatus Woesearchaeota archaeon]|nr:hypothetical protein [Candidatus Woesearchaeota archaeon]